MAARPTILNVGLSTWGQPVTGLVSKTYKVTGPFNAQQTAASVATTDVVSVSADYGIYDTTTSSNLDTNSTNFKDNV